MATTKTETTRGSASVATLTKKETARGPTAMAGDNVNLSHSCCDVHECTCMFSIISGLLCSLTDDSHVNATAPCMLCPLMHFTQACPPMSYIPLVYDAYGDA